MRIRRVSVGIPEWAKKQDEREDELKKKYPKKFNKVCERFYELRNYNPYNDPEFCFNEAVMMIEMDKKTYQDFYKVFVVKFEAGDRQNA